MPILKSRPRGVHMCVCVWGGRSKQRKLGSRVRLLVYVCIRNINTDLNAARERNIFAQGSTCFSLVHYKVPLNLRHKFMLYTYTQLRQYILLT